MKLALISLAWTVFVVLSLVAVAGVGYDLYDFYRWYVESL